MQALLNQPKSNSLPESLALYLLDLPYLQIFLDPRIPLIIFSILWVPNLAVRHTVLKAMIHLEESHHPKTIYLIFLTFQGLDHVCLAQYKQFDHLLDFLERFPKFVLAKKQINFFFFCSVLPPNPLLSCHFPKDHLE